MSQKREANSKGRRPVKKLEPVLAKPRPVSKSEPMIAKARPASKRGSELDQRGDAPGDLVRKFEGREVLQALLSASGSLADAEDVAEVFRQAADVDAPPSVVIQALWEDEPIFETPAKARRMFSNLLGLHDLIVSGVKVDLRPDAPPVRTKREKAKQPEAFDEVPDEGFVEAAWRFFDDHPKDRERHQHAFENRQDALLSWVDEAGLSDEGFGLTTMMLSDVFAMLELGGMHIGLVKPAAIPKVVTDESLPPALAAWVDEGIFEAEEHEAAPLAAAQAQRVRDLALRGSAALWAVCR